MSAIAMQVVAAGLELAAATEAQESEWMRLGKISTETRTRYLTATEAHLKACAMYRGATQ